MVARLLEPKLLKKGPQGNTKLSISDGGKSFRTKITTTTRKQQDHYKFPSAVKLFSVWFCNMAGSNEI